MPASDASKRATPTSSAAAMLASAESARVVEVSAPEPVAGDSKRLREQRAHGARIGVADGVGKTHAVGAGVEQRLQQAQHLRRVDAALQRATERRAHAALDQRLRAGRVARRADPRHFGDDLVRRPAEVGEAVRATRGQRNQHEIGATIERALGALEIRHENRREEAGQGPGMREDFRGVGKLRQQAGRHERADLDLAQPGRMGVADPVELAGGRQDRRDALQAIAQTDLAYDDA